VTLSALVRRSVTYHWRTNLAVILGVAAAVSVLAGALVVGDSVRGSLRDIALGRLGRTDQVVASSGFFRDALAADLKNAAGVTGAAPLVIANGFVTHEASGRRSAGVLVYGVDERFWQFNGLDVPDGVYASPALATELSAKEGDVLLTRLQRPSEIPIESLFGRKDEVGRTVRLTVTGVLPRERLGEFALQPQQTEVRAVFAPLRRIQRDLAVPDQVNTVLVSGTASLDALRSTLKLEDIGARVTVTSEVPAVAVESASGIISEELERAALQASKELGFAPVPIFTYLANSIRKGDRQVPYSLITAIDLSRLPAAASPRPVTGEQLDRMVLNEWAARELGAVQGDRLEIEYYLWDPVGGLQTKSTSFTLTGIVPIAGLAADRTLAPTYPGITNSPSLADWDPPFPIDLSRVREQDEKYWDVYRTTPKAFISY
jgi:putative ABC transport system permease protein